MKMKTILFQLERLTCPSCIREIEEGLSSQEGVRFAKVLFHANQVKVNYDDTLISKEQLEKALELHGFPSTIGTAS